MHERTLTRISPQKDTGSTMIPAETTQQADTTEYVNDVPQDLIDIVKLASELRFGMVNMDYMGYDNTVAEPDEWLVMISPNSEGLPPSEYTSQQGFLICTQTPDTEVRATYMGEELNKDQIIAWMRMRTPNVSDDPNTQEVINFIPDMIDLSLEAYRRGWSARMNVRRMNIKIPDVAEPERIISGTIEIIDMNNYYNVPGHPESKAVNPDTRTLQSNTLVRITSGDAPYTRAIMYENLRLNHDRDVFIAAMQAGPNWFAPVTEKEYID